MMFRHILGVGIFGLVASFNASAITLQDLSFTDLSTQVSGLDNADQVAVVASAEDVKAALFSIAAVSSKEQETTTNYRSSGCSMGCSSGCSSGCSMGCSSGCSMGCSSGCRY